MKVGGPSRLALHRADPPPPDVPQPALVAPAETVAPSKRGYEWAYGLALGLPLGFLIAEVIF